MDKEGKEEPARPRRIAARKVLTYNINYHQVGYHHYAEREFQKALKYSLLEAEAAQARLLEQNNVNRRKSQEKKENSQTKQSNRTDACRKSLQFDTSTDPLNDFNEPGRTTTTLGDHNRLQSTAVKASSLTQSSQSAETKQTFLHLSADDQSSPLSNTPTKTTPATTIISQIKKEDKQPQTVARLHKSDSTRSNQKKTNSSVQRLFSSPKSSRCHRPMRKAKPNVSLYDFHIEFDDEEANSVNGSNSKRPLKKIRTGRKRKQTKMFCIQTSFQNEIRKRLLQKSIKYSVKTNDSTCRTPRNISNRIFTSKSRHFQINKSPPGQISPRPVKKIDTSSTRKEGVDKQTLRKTQILLRNLYKLRQHIHCRRQELVAEQALNSPLRSVFKNMAKDLRLLLCQPDQSKLETIFYDPLTISGLMMSTTADRFAAPSLSELIESIEMTTVAEKSSLPEAQLLDEVVSKLENQLEQELKDVRLSERPLKKEKEENGEEEDLEFSTAQSSPAGVN